MCNESEKVNKKEARATGSLTSNDDHTSDVVAERARLSRLIHLYQHGTEVPDVHNYLQFNSKTPLMLRQCMGIVDFMPGWSL